VKELYDAVPSGLGRRSVLKLDTKALDEILRGGVRRLLEMGYGDERDLEYIESRGQFADGDPSDVSQEAKNRGRDQLGTIGSGNHFVEVEYVERIFDEKAATILGLREGQMVVLIHTGSRGLGHQIATDYIREMMGAMKKYGIVLPDRELAAAPFSSPEGKRYFSAMKAGAHFAWANRELITHSIRNVWRKVFGDGGSELPVVYDVAHNMAKLEEYEIEGRKKRLIVHRKGATRSFGPGHEEIPLAYREIGQPVFIPGSMGTASYVLVGEKRAEEETFATSCHGAGRTMSRHQAKRVVDGRALKDALEEQGIHIAAGSLSGIAEEAPLAYKDVDRVVEVVERAGIARRVARLKPVAVVKG
jgi:tRNA-splicing ligase RtcB